MEESITFDFDRNQYHRFLKFITKKRYRWILILCAVCAVAALLISIYGYVNTGTTTVLESWTPLLICIILWFVFLTWWLPRQVAFNKLNQRSLQITTISKTDSYLELSLESGYLERVPYIDIVKYEYTEEYAVFWNNYIDAIIVPRYAFESTEHYKSFTKGIIKHVET